MNRGLNTIETKLRSHKSYIMEQYHVEDMGIFGSYVNNRQRKGSDVDILIDFKSGHKGIFNYMRLKYYLKELLKKDVDLVMRDALKQRIKERILREVLYV